MLCIAAITSAAVAGTETYSSKEMKQVAPPSCPQWYADNEFNVSLWSTYIFTGNNWQDDRYLESDHAFGGGVDLKYFFHRYFGVGIEVGRRMPGVHLRMSSASARSALAASRDTRAAR